MLLGLGMIAAATALSSLRGDDGPDYWLGDPRLPDRKLAMKRVHGELRPKVQEPHRIINAAKRFIPPAKDRAAVLLRVVANSKRTRWWFTALYGHDKPDTQFSRPEEDGRYYSFMADYDSTTSAKKAQGWIDALSR